MLSFALIGIVCSFTALCYAEFASMVPVSGFAYTYAYASLGELTVWIIGWDLIIEYAMSNVAAALNWGNYCKTLLAGFGVQIPTWLSTAYRTASHMVDTAGVYTVYREAPHLFGVPIVFNALAVCIIALITLILVWGIRLYQAYLSESPLGHPSRCHGRRLPPRRRRSEVSDSSLIRRYTRHRPWE